ncbi:MAG: rRNA maturation RNase YbeY [Proteobacteria bacterium]|nr:rRNA maturation RNase YbeY [Pseudomonadota bacterium]
MSVNVEIAIEETLWKQEDKAIAQKLEDLISKILPETDLAKYIDNDDELEISILLTNDQAIQKLNHTYRQKDKATNVLSFPTFNDEGQGIEVEGFVPLGDIVLSYETIKKEALEQNKSFINHLSHLVVHSILHLIGYDHIDDQEAENMEKLEIKILKKLDIDNPYNISAPL